MTPGRPMRSTAAFVSRARRGDVAAGASLFRLWISLRMPSMVGSRRAVRRGSAAPLRPAGTPRALVGGQRGDRRADARCARDAGSKSSACAERRADQLATRGRSRRRGSERGGRCSWSGAGARTHGGADDRRRRRATGAARPALHGHAGAGLADETSGCARRGSARAPTTPCSSSARPPRARRLRSRRREPRFERISASSPRACFTLLQDFARSRAGKSVRSHD